MSTLAEVEAAIVGLSVGELAQLEDSLRKLRHQRAAEVEPALPPTDLAGFAGVLSLTEDPLAWQRKICGEWS